MKAVTGEAMAALDRRAQEEGGIPGLLLMENAGRNAWKQFLVRFGDGLPRDASLLFAAGSGNNGGDALVMARQAATDGFSRVTVLLLKDESGCGESVRLHAGIVRHFGVKVLSYADNPGAAASVVEQASVVFDGIAGTGLKGPLRGDAAELVGLLNRARSLKVAVDIPSGIGEGPVFRADCTLVMELVKFPLLSPEGRKHSGELLMVPVGFPPEMVRETESSAEYLLPGSDVPPGFPGHYYKNRRGHLLVCGGAPGTEGAAFLCARGAAKSGAGLVTLMADRNIAQRAGVETSGVMVRENGTGDLSFADAVVLGPGWGRGPERGAMFRTAVEEVPAGVLDADAIDLLAQWMVASGRRLGEGTGDARWIITPHPGEALRLVDALGTAGRLRGFLPDGEAATSALLGRRPWALLPALAREVNAVVVLKSHVTHIVSPDGEYAVVEGGNALLGTGGSGDVLAGICGSLLLRHNLNAFRAAVSAVCIHQRAGKAAAAGLGVFTAGELLRFVGLESAGGPQHE